jgi:hypothetical protein
MITTDAQEYMMEELSPFIRDMIAFVDQYEPVIDSRPDTIKCDQGMLCYVAPTWIARLDRCAICRAEVRTLWDPGTNERAVHEFDMRDNRLGWADVCADHSSCKTFLGFSIQTSHLST